MSLPFYCINSNRLSKQWDGQCTLEEIAWGPKKGSLQTKYLRVTSLITLLTVQDMFY